MKLEKSPEGHAIFEACGGPMFFLLKVFFFFVFHLEKRRSGRPRPFSTFLFRQVEAFWRLVPTVVTLRCAWPWQFPTVVWYLWRLEKGTQRSRPNVRWHGCNLTLPGSQQKQVDPAHMVIARNMVAYAGMAHMIDIWTGHSYLTLQVFFGRVLGLEAV